MRAREKPGDLVGPHVFDHFARDDEIDGRGRHRSESPSDAVIHSTLCGRSFGFGANASTPMCRSTGVG